MFARVRLMGSVLGEVCATFLVACWENATCEGPADVTVVVHLHTNTGTGKHAVTFNVARNDVLVPLAVNISESYLRQLEQARSKAAFNRIVRFMVMEYVNVKG